MNPLNYASLSASRRLVEAGIVLETEAVWYRVSDSHQWVLYSKKEASKFVGQKIPAPCMAEVWREFKDEELVDTYIRRVPFSHDTLVTKAIPHYDSSGELESTTFERWQDANPTNALIDLLIWVRKEANNGR